MLFEGSTASPTGRDILDSTNLALAVGAGVEKPLTKLLSLRLFQIDYAPARFTGRWAHNFRVQAGLTFQFY